MARKIHHADSVGNFEKGKHGKYVKHLYRSKENRIFAGIIGGVGEFFDVDPVILRVLFVIVTLVTAFLPLFLLYLICIFIIPENPHQ
ncbi:PspC domain-containing protein [Candidatus Woesearchaeota archaeon]|nr:PspC domain-containing protein [Nanoarchaeota archaeon]MCB9370200.1 PspC domain-containing protein [Candidatus Woesearchaeota archaeon]